MIKKITLGVNVLNSFFSHKFYRFLIGVIFVVLALILENNSNYTTGKFRRVCVINKIATETLIKSGYYTKLNLVLKETSTGRVFTKIVSPELYSTKEINSCFNFKLQEMEIEPNLKENIYFTCRIILLSLGVSILVPLIFFNI